MPAPWLERSLDLLGRQPVCGYTPEQAPAAEPTALAALALATHGRTEEAKQAGDWLVEIQAPAGSVGIRAESPEPRWPTALAILAWTKLAEHAGGNYERPLGLATGALLSIHGKTLSDAPDMGHDTNLIAWPWVEGTHSWIEPSALAVLALKSQGMSDAPRTREAVRLLIDRQLPAGGCNYGNTIVLGQTLRPHVQPTGLALAALAGEEDASGRLMRSVAFLRRSLNEQTTSASLAWGLLGMTAQGARPASADTWLAAAGARTLARGSSPHRLALLALAAAEGSPLAASPTTASNYSNPGALVS